MPPPPCLRGSVDTVYRKFPFTVGAQTYGATRICVPPSYSLSIYVGAPVAAVAGVGSGDAGASCARATAVEAASVNTMPEASATKRVVRFINLAGSF